MPRRRVPMAFLVVLAGLAGLGAHAADRLPVAEERESPSRGASLSLNVSPGLSLPLGESAERFGLGGQVDLLAEYAFREQPRLFVSGGLGYGLAPISVDPVQSVSLIRFSAGPGVSFDIIPRLSLKAVLGAGYYHGLLNDASSYTGSGATAAGGALVHGGLDFDLLVTPALSLNLGATYRNHLGLLQALELRLGGSYYITGTGQRRLKIQRSGPSRLDLLREASFANPGEGIKINAVELAPIFPVFHKYYDDHPVGRLELFNQGDAAVSDLSVTLYIRQYMDAPKECSSSLLLEPGQSRVVDLYALFTDSVLTITEGTKVTGEISLLYRMDGTLYQDSRTETFRLHNRNAMTWDDTRKAAAFVTARDPAILSFSKSVSSIVRGRAGAALNSRLLQAIALYEALGVYGLSYVVDPSTPYAELSRSREQIDFLQFPRQTLEYRGGDCDDLSILYCALLESIAVQTAFITVPGHILMAFALGMSPAESQREFMGTDDLIYQDGEAWLPVEVTERRGGFVRAWKSGAASWRRHVADGQAELFRVGEAWTMYEPVGLPGGSSELMLPRDDSVLQAYLEEVTRFVNREILPRVVKLEREIESTGGNPAVRNRLGILYARYGKIEEARAQFELAVKDRDYYPAWVGLGNLRYMEGDWQGALSCYERAYRQEPANPSVLLCLSRAHYELEQYRQSRSTYAELVQRNPELADQYAYLGSGDESAGRAADASIRKEALVWEEED
ncbi:MAG: hypothetical protein JW820_16620 [Spirochaetales bacterium]|nr:hypothetical protein [Spirochaetales bacterium]